MSWFKRSDKGILTPTESKREVPDGLWFKSPAGKIVHTRELKNNAYVVPDEDYHVRIGSEEYFEVLFDDNKFTELDANMESADPLKFKDTKPYPKRIKETQEKSQLKDAVRTAYGKMNGLDITIACMDFSFIGGSMGSVVGEKIARAMDHSIKNKIPFLMISSQKLFPSFSISHGKISPSSATVKAEVRFACPSWRVQCSLNGCISHWFMPSL